MSPTELPKEYCPAGPSGLQPPPLLGVPSCLSLLWVLQAQARALVSSKCEDGAEVRNPQRLTGPEIHEHRGHTHLHTDRCAQGGTHLHMYAHSSAHAATHTVARRHTCTLGPHTYTCVHTGPTETHTSTQFCVHVNTGNHTQLHKDTHVHMGPHSRYTNIPKLAHPHRVCTQQVHAWSRMCSKARREGGGRAGPPEGSFPGASDPCPGRALLGRLAPGSVGVGWAPPPASAEPGAAVPGHPNPAGAAWVCDGERGPADPERAPGGPAERLPVQRL